MHRPAAIFAVSAPLRRALAAGLILAAGLLLSGCPRAADYFPEYRDGTGNRNLIAGRLLSAEWQFGEQLSTLSDPSIYLGFSAAEGISPPEEASSGATAPEVFRLELKNLLPDGAFSQSDTGALSLATPYHGWSFYDAYAKNDQTWEIVNAGAGVINGNTLHYLTTSGPDRLDFDLRDAQWGARDGLVEGALYLVRYSYRTERLPVFFEFGDHEEQLSLLHWTFYSGSGGGIAGSSLDNLLEFPPTVVADKYDFLSPNRDIDTYYLSFGSVESGIPVSPQDAYIDNLRLIRADIPPVVELRLPYELESTDLDVATSTLTLISGRYRFSIWVRQDPEAETEAAPNRYRARAVSLSVSGGGLGEAYAGSTVSYRQSFTDSEGAWDQWTRLSIETDTVQITRPVDPETPVLTLSVAPCDWFTAGGMQMDAGTILVSAPSLEFISTK